MASEPIDATKLILRTLGLIGDGRRAAEQGWQRITTAAKDATTAPADRRRPPEIW